MAPRKKRASPKRLEREELKNLDAIQFTVRASEANLQRIAALMLFADPLEAKLIPAEQPLPWEDPSDPRFQKPPEVQIERPTLEKDVTGRLVVYLEKYGHDATREMISSFGGPRLRDLTDAQLLGLQQALQALEAAGE